MSSDGGEIIIPVADELSDGTVDSWPTTDGRWEYSFKDDYSWRVGLAEMWVKESGAEIPGKFLFSVRFIPPTTLTRPFNIGRL